MNENFKQLDHTPAHLSHAMAGLRFGAKSLLEGVRQTEAENGNPNEQGGWERMLLRAEQAFMQVIQDYRHRLKNGNGFVGVCGLTPPFPLLIRCDESIEVEFSPEPTLVIGEAKTKPRPELKDWQNLFEKEGSEEKMKVKEPLVAEDDFSGLDFLDTLVAPTAKPADSAKKTLADHGDMRVMAPVETAVPEEGDPTPLIPEDTLNGLLNTMEQTRTLTVPKTPMISIKEPECLTDAIRLWVSEGQFTEKPGGIYVPKKTSEEPLELDMELFNRCFPESPSD